MSLRVLTTAAALTITVAIALSGYAIGMENRDTLIVTETETATVTAPPKTVEVTRTVRAARDTNRTHVSQRPKSDNKAGSKYHNDVWARIAQCESGGRLHAESPSGLYLGLYQLHRGFYITHGYRGDSWKQLTAAQQLDIARYVKSRQGWRAWPVCGKKAGVL